MTKISWLPEKTTPISNDEVTILDGADSNPDTQNKRSLLSSLWDGIFSNRTTTDIPEWTNLYYTEARVTANTTVVWLWNTKADKTNVLEKDNTTPFTPTADFHPATKKSVDDGVASVSPKFGWDGSDWALNTSWGTVDINLWWAEYVLKNYTSINIATNNLTFSNPWSNGTIIVLKSQGDVIISATIDASWMWGPWWMWWTGVFLWDNWDNWSVWLNIDDSATFWLWWKRPQTSFWAWGVWGGKLTTTFLTNTLLRLSEKRIKLFAGSGWGWGWAWTNWSQNPWPDWGDWGGWGWGLYIETGWSLDFTWTINVDWADWVDWVFGLSWTSWAWWWWGWWGWSLVILYNSLIANSWTTNTKSWVWWDWSDANGIQSDDQTWAGGWWAWWNLDWIWGTWGIWGTAIWGNWANWTSGSGGGWGGIRDSAWTWWTWWSAVFWTTNFFISQNTEF